jgi:hypothetical protein
MEPNKEEEDSILFYTFNQDLTCVLYFHFYTFLFHFLLFFNSSSLLIHQILHFLIIYYFSCLAVGTKTGFKIFSCDPFQLLYSCGKASNSQILNFLISFPFPRIFPDHTRLISLNVVKSHICREWWNINY